MKLNLKALERQQDLINFQSLATPITIIGAGAVGGTAAFFLSKMGMCNIRLFDFDEVDMVNMNCQMFGLHNIGQAKVDAISSTVEQWCGNKVEAINKAFEPSDWHALSGIVLSGADSMKVRKEVFEAWLKSPSATHLIDTRMSIEYLAVYVISKDDKKAVADYTKTLYSDEQAVQERCTLKSVIYTAALAGGWVCKAVKDIIVTGKPSYFQCIFNIAKNDCMFFE